MSTPFTPRRALWGAAGALSLVLALGFQPAKPKASQTKAAGLGKETCYQCHDQIQTMKEGSKHW